MYDVTVCVLSYQVVEDVTLMNVNRDERLELDSLELFEVTCRLLDERVEEVEETLVGGRHYLLVVTSVVERVFSVARPDDLNAEETDLSGVRGEELEELEVLVVDDDRSFANDTMQGALLLHKQLPQPLLDVAARHHRFLQLR